MADSNIARLLTHAFVPFFAHFGSLRPVHLETIPRILAGENVLITAPTGSGKTEAVVAPLAERALAVQDSVYALYICPTRALINDLQSRIEGRLAQMDLRLAVQHRERKTLHYRRVPSFVVTTPSRSTCS